MCGIAGAITLAPISENRIKRTISAMCKRGPDKQSYLQFQLKNGYFLTLLFSRLSIVDLSDESMQPIATEKGKYMIFNGEIYNYKDIKEMFTAQNIVFKSKGDAEVLYHLIRSKGVGSLCEVDGMFALAYFDEETEVLTLARDFFGEKPLLTFKDSSGFYFGSQNSFIFGLLDVKPRINYDKCANYLIIGYKSIYSDNRTFFQNVFNVPSGSYQQYDLYGNKIREDFFRERIPEVNSFDGNFDSAAKLTRESVIKSLESRLAADVPVTFCMSGGVDSSILTAITKKLFGLDVETYTLANRDDKYDESLQVSQICQKLGIESNFVFPIKEDFVSRMENLVQYRGAPVSTISYFIHSFLSEKICADGYRVAIMGTGADELFTGYYDHFNSHFASLYKINNRDELVRAIKDWKQTAGKHVRNPTFSDPYAYVSKQRDLSHFNDGFQFQQYFSNAYLDQPLSIPVKFYQKDLLRNQMANELFHESVPMILNEDDLNSMQFSIENRSPYLNVDLFSLSLSFPNTFLIREGFTKAPLRYAFKDLLPSDILFSTKKVGFNASIDEFLPTDQSLINSRLLNADSTIWQFVDRDSFIALLRRPDGSNSRNKFIFAVLSLKFFLDLYV